MKLNEVKKIIFLVLMILTQFCHSEYPVVHSEDKLGIISLIKKLGISESNFSVTDRKQYTDT